jgi:predicted cupin superfamily sugar epimerase
MYMTAELTAELTAAEICSLLNLEPNATCGSVRVSFVSQQSIAAGGLPAPFADGRPLGSALYFLVTPGAPVRLHRIRNEQLYHYYLGDPLKGSCCTPTEAASAWSSDPTSVVASVCNSAFPGTRSTRRG